MTQLLRLRADMIRVADRIAETLVWLIDPPKPAPIRIAQDRPRQRSPRA